MIKYLKRRKDLRHYRKLRGCQVKLHSEMTKGLSRDNFLETANDFRMVKNGTIVFDSENDYAYLNDRLIYDTKMQGKSRAELFYEENKESLSNNEKKMLNAMKNSKYSLFLVKDVTHGYGACLTDVFSEEKLFLFDINMSQTMPPGHLTSLRVISLEGINFASGISCVFEIEYLDRLKKNFVDLFEKKRHMMTWDEMMNKYNTYFYKMMKQSGKEITFLRI